MTDWKPIETAPKDGTIVDLWVGSERIADCYFEREAWRHWWIGGFDQMDSVKIDGEPSHWMQIPSPPEREK